MLLLMANRQHSRWIGEMNAPPPLEVEVRAPVVAPAAYLPAQVYGKEIVAAPLAWNAEHVQTRLIEAFTIVGKTVTRPGPRAFGNAMPDVVREFADYAGRDEALGERQEKWMADVEAMRRNDEFSAVQFDLADEAMGWCLRHLADRQVEADALQLWAWGHARGLGEKAFEKMLRRRALAADRLVERRKHDLPDKVTIYEEEAEAAARKIAAWANEALAKEKDKRARGRIKMAAFIRFRREVKTVRAVERKVYVRRCDVMPGRVFSVSQMERYRKAGATRMAERLRRADVMVR